MIYLHYALIIYLHYAHTIKTNAYIKTNEITHIKTNGVTLIIYLHYALSTLCNMHATFPKMNVPCHLNRIQGIYHPNFIK